jgi:hypothetical protein
MFSGPKIQVELLAPGPKTFGLRDRENSDGEGGVLTSCRFTKRRNESREVELPKSFSDLMHEFSFR